MKTVIRLSFIFILAGWFCSCGFQQGASIPTVSSPKPIDLSAVPDGTFRGNHPTANADYQVHVVVEKNAIRDISIIKTKDRYFLKKCALCDAEALIQEILEEQTLQVDAITGATQTSRGIFKAIEDALRPPFDQLCSHRPTE